MATMHSMIERKQTVVSEAQSSWTHHRMNTVLLAHEEFDMETSEQLQTGRTRTHLTNWPLPHIDNKYLQQKWARAYDIHTEKLNSAKPVMDTSPPTTYDLIQTLSQRKLKHNEEQTKTIERENKMLKERMSHTTGGLDSWNYFEGNRLGKERKRQLELHRITEENRMIHQRLSQCRPHYSVKSWHEDWLKTLTLRDRLTYYPRGRANQQDSDATAVQTELEQVTLGLCSMNINGGDATAPAAAPE